MCVFGVCVYVFVKFQYIWCACACVCVCVCVCVIRLKCLIVYAGSVELCLIELRQESSPEGRGYRLLKDFYSPLWSSQLTAPNKCSISVALWRSTLAILI